MKKEEQKKNIAGDEISIGNIHEDSAVAIGRGARAEVNVFNKKIYLDIRLLPVVLLLVVLVVVLAFYLLKKDIPDEMGGEFNIAIAEFTVLDEDGKTLRSDEGEKLSQWLYNRLDANLSELDVQYEIWPPEYTGKILGSTENEREQAAELFAYERKAHVVIYGTITISDERSKFTPEFFISSSGFEEGDEITGKYELGDALLIAFPFDPNQLQDIENPTLSARAEALSLVTVGLAYYSIDDFEKAIGYFVQAENIQGWFDTDGKEILYLLLGNANIREASKNKAPELLSTSTQYYETALEINPSYTRAIIGMAGVEYLRALGDPLSDDINLALLEKSEKLYLEALEIGHPFESANIEPKVHFGLGQIYLARSQISSEEWLGKAKIEFEQVISEYDGGNQRIENRCGHAYARLGLIAKIEDDIPLAIDYYQKASELVSPFYQVYYLTRLAEVYASNDSVDLAIGTYEEAIDLAKFYGDAESVEKYTSRLNELMNQQ